MHLKIGGRSLLQTDEEEIIRYLLDELPEEVRVRIEETIEVEPALLDRIAEVEDNLILHYLREELDGVRRTRFEHCYLASARKHDRVERSRLLFQAARSVALM